MSVKTFVECDKCGKEWEEKGTLGGFWVNDGKGYQVYFCDNCATKYIELLARLGREEGEAIRAFIAEGKNASAR